MDQSSTYYEKISQPIIQAGLTLGSIVLIMLVAKLFQLVELTTVVPTFYWKTATALLFFFAIFNSVFSLITKDKIKYWRNSIYSFLSVAVFGGLLAWLASSLSIYEAGSYYSIYMVVTIGFLVFSSITAMLRKIVEYAENEKWEKPRKHKKK